FETQLEHAQVVQMREARRRRILERVGAVDAVDLRRLEDRLRTDLDGATIRLSIPPLTEERRKDLVKLVKKKSEEHKVAVRNVRHHANDQVKELAKKGTITDDQIKRGTDQVQKLTDKYVKQIDDLVHGKEKEIMEV
ncbi:MAG TPA: ribosome-recycling factor, partial [Candidatus Elarobacter sp.]|nr:ribosome-recycling factor [Candidatus Elarobacter sp.]